MLIQDAGHFFELYGVAIRMAASVFVCLLLFAFLLLRTFPGLGTAVLRTAFELSGIPPLEHGKNASAFKRPLSGLTPRLSVGSEIAGNRAYRSLVGTSSTGAVNLDYPSTSEPDEGNVLIKIPLNSTGERILRRENNIIKYLRRQAGGTSYLKYLPEPLVNTSQSDPDNYPYRYDPALLTAGHIRRHFPEGLDGRHLAWMFNRMLEVLGFVHREGTVHGAVLPQHLLFDVRTHGLILADWTHAKRIGSRFTFLPRKYRPWYPPEARHRQYAVPQSDIYMAAQCLIYLGGAAPEAGRLPEQLPPKFKTFLRSCLLESPRMRPADAWQLHEEFRDILEDIYGPPEFHQLEIYQGECNGWNHLV